MKLYKTGKFVKTGLAAILAASTAVYAYTAPANAALATPAAGTAFDGAADASAMMAALEMLTKEPRVWTSENNDAVRAYITETMTGYGYEVSEETFERDNYDYELLVDGEVHEGATITNIDAYAVTTPKTYVGRNLIAVREADALEKTSEETSEKTSKEAEEPALLIVGAHYDSETDAPGANDNGSGLVTLLEVARLVKDLPSELEVRFLFFDAEEIGLVGSHIYAQSLTDDELARVVGMINFDMLGSKEAAAVTVATPDGGENYLTKLFGAFEPRADFGSDHFSFHSLTIPVVSISHETVGPYHSPDDTVDYIDPDKLVRAAEEGAEVLAYLMDNPPAKPSEESGAGPERKAFVIGDEAMFSMGMNKTDVESGLGIETVQVPARPENSADYVTVHEADVTLWGVDCTARFEYMYGGEMLASLSASVSDAEALAAALDERFERADGIEGLEVQASAEEGSCVWLSDAGIAFVLNEGEDAGTLYVSGYGIYSYYEYESGEFTGELNDSERAAWERLGAMIDLASLEDEVKAVTFVEDGFGANSLYMESDFLTGDISITLDPNELTDERGSLYTDESLTHAFLMAYADYIFNGNGQVDYDMLYNRDGVEYGYGFNGFLPDSYLSAYMSEFGIETDPDASFFDRYWQEQDVIAEMCEALVAYVTNPEGLAQDKIDFFDGYDEFSR